MTTYGTIETILLRLAVLATNNRGKTVAEYEAERQTAETRLLNQLRRIQKEAEQRERETWARAWEQWTK